MRQSGVCLLVEVGNVVGGFLLSNVRLLLPQLFIEDGHLVSCGPGLCFRLLKLGLRLLHACPQLLVVEHGDDVSSGYAVSLAHSDFENTATRLGGHSRVVTFDSTTERDDVWRHRRRVEEHSPNAKSDGRENHNDNQRNNDSTGHRAGRLRIGGPRLWFCWTGLRDRSGRLRVWLRRVRRRRSRLRVRLGRLICHRIRLRFCLGWVRCGGNRLWVRLPWLRIGTIAPQGRDRCIKSLDFLLCSFPFLLQLLDYFRHVSHYRRRRRFWFELRSRRRSLRFWLGPWFRLVVLWKFLRPVDHQLFRHLLPRLLDTVARRSPEFACRRYASEKSQICSAIRSTCSGVISNSGQSCFSRGPART